MALAFKREQKTWEEGGRKNAWDRISAAVGKEIPIEVDYDALKGISGEGEWYSGKKENNNALALRYLNEQAQWICLTIEGIANDDYGKECCAEHLNKIWFTITDKGKKGCDMRSITCFDVALEAKTLKITCNLDFTSYIAQSFPYDEIMKIAKALLEPKYFLEFKRQRKKVEEGNQKYYQDRLTSSLGYETPFEIDWEGIKQIQGTAEWYSEKPEPRNVLAGRYLEECAIAGVVYAFEAVGKDDLGKEAMKETFTKVVFHVTDQAPKGADLREMSTHKWEKIGTEGHLTCNLDFTSYVGQSFPDGGLKSIVETQL